MKPTPQELLEIDLKIKQREIERLEAELIKLSTENNNLLYMLTAATGRVWTDEEKKRLMGDDNG